MPVIELPWAGVEKARLQIVFTRSVSGKPAQDVATTTIAFRATSAAIADWNATVENSDMAGVEASFDTFLSNVSAYYHTSHKLAEYRWYELKTPWAPVGDPMRVNTKATPVAGSGSFLMAPQLAINTTLETDERKHWGRQCWPFNITTQANGDGRASSSAIDMLAVEYKACLDRCISAHMHPIIYSKPSGQQRDVKRIRVDDTYDIIRRRRYEGVPYRKLLTLQV